MTNCIGCEVGHHIALSNLQQLIDDGELSNDSYIEFSLNNGKCHDPGNGCQEQYACSIDFDIYIMSIGLTPHPVSGSIKNWDSLSGQIFGTPINHTLGHYDLPFEFQGTWSGVCNNQWNTIIDLQLLTNGCYRTISGQEVWVDCKEDTYLYSFRAKCSGCEEESAPPE